MNNKLMGVLIGLARASFSNEDKLTPETDRIIIDGLAAYENANDATLTVLTEKAVAEKRRLIPLCFECAFPCGKNNDYNMADLWEARPEIRSLKLLILTGICKIASKIQCTDALSHTDPEITEFLYKALFAVGADDWDQEYLLPVVLETGNIIAKCKNS